MGQGLLSWHGFGITRCVQTLVSQLNPSSPAHTWMGLDGINYWSPWFTAQCLSSFWYAGWVKTIKKLRTPPAHFHKQECVFLNQFQWLLSHPAKSPLIYCGNMTFLCPPLWNPEHLSCPYTHHRVDQHWPIPKPQKWHLRRCLGQPITTI